MVAPRAQGLKIYRGEAANREGRGEGLVMMVAAEPSPLTTEPPRFNNMIDF